MPDKCRTTYVAHPAQLDDRIIYIICKWARIVTGDQARRVRQIEIPPPWVDGGTGLPKAYVVESARGRRTL